MALDSQGMAHLKGLRTQRTSTIKVCGGSSGKKEAQWRGDTRFSYMILDFTRDLERLNFRGKHSRSEQLQAIWFGQRRSSSEELDEEKNEPADGA